MLKAHPNCGGYVLNAKISLPLWRWNVTPSTPNTECPMIVSSPASNPVGIVGFTGTREGMTEAQKSAFRQLVHKCSTLHHGDCIGSDAEAHAIAKSFGLKVITHPPLNPEFRAYCKGDNALAIAKSYTERNRDIVNAAPCLIATPKEQTEVSKGGTWQTVRYARKQGKRVIIIWPNGATTEEMPL